MCGHVSLLSLCLLFVSSSVQGGQENLPSTWTRIVRQDANVQLDEGKEEEEKTCRVCAEQMSNCFSRTLELQTKLDEVKKTMEENRRANTEQLSSANSRTLVLEARLEEKKEGMEQLRQMYAAQLENLNTRLDDAQKTSDTLRKENLRFQQQLEESTTKFDRLEAQLVVTTEELKTKTSELTRCDIESATLREKVRQTTKNIEVLKNQTVDFQQDIYDVILNATNLQTVYVKEVTKQIEQDFTKMNTNITETVLQNKAALKSTSDKIVQEILNSKLEISNKSNDILQELASTKSKIEAGFATTTEERESICNGLQSKQGEILQVIGAMKIQAENASLVITDYYSETHRLNWQDAQKYCRSIGQNLVTIENAVKNQIIKDRKNKLGMEDTWIGGTDQAEEGTSEESMWRWIGTGQIMIYKNWWGGYPDGGTGKNCLEMRRSGSWYAYECTSVQPFICEL